MTNANKRPWYKSAAYLSVIVAIVAIVVTIILWLLSLPPPDFSISVDPMQGEVYQGGVIQTTITVDSTRYKYPVSLSASGQPSGIVIVFVPPLGEAKPPYTSSVTIYVDSNVPVDGYEITIKGIGADGKEFSCKYILNVMPRQVTPTPALTPSLTPSPTPQIEIEMISPKEGDEVPLNVEVRGTISGELPKGQYMWIVVNPHTAPGQWWPQAGRIEPWKGQWYGQVRIGSEDAGIEEKFDIAAILVDERDNQYYWNYLKTGQETGSYPGIPLPDSAMIIDRITVVRK